MTDVSEIRVESNSVKPHMEEYEFVGFPLTSGSVEKVIFLCCSGNLSRSEIIERVFGYHLRNGGTDSKSNKSSMVKKALSNLISKGEIPKQVMKGYYVIDNKGEKLNSYSISDYDLESQVSDLQETPGALYVYYYPSYERLASLEGKSSWPIKIGQTDSYVSSRLNAQATAFPEPPVILHTINSKNPRLLESTIHGIFKLRGKSCYENTKDESMNSGTEWFETNPEELSAVLEFLDVKSEDYFSIV